MSYITGNTIRLLREKKQYTQKQLAEHLAVSDKTVSKWETGKGLPDISMVEALARDLQVSVAELLSGECVINGNKVGNMMRSHFYVCPICGNVIHAQGEGAFSCCGVVLPPLEAEEMESGEMESEEVQLDHEIRIEKVDNEYYVSSRHPMDKDHYLSFYAYVTSCQLQMVKLYPEQSPEARLRICGTGMLYVYCNRHGLFRMKVRKM